MTTGEIANPYTIRCPLRHCEAATVVVRNAQAPTVAENAAYLAHLATHRDKFFELYVMAKVASEGAR